MNKGFTLVEMLVSVAIFSIVMVIALGSLLAMSESDRKAQTLKSVINNLNFSLDSMSRAIRTGTTYHCDIGQGSATATRDCSGTPAASMAFKAADGSTVSYCFASGAILREVTPSSGTPDTSCAAAGFAAITSPEVVISSLSFYIIGATDPNIQPKVTILVSGAVQQSATQQTKFNLETSVTQRLYDL